MGFMDYRPAGFIKGTATAAPFIYDANGHLILQFGYVAGVSSIKGQVATGTDLNVYANSTDAYPYWRLHGDGEIEFYHAVGSYASIFDGAVQALKVTYAANVTTIEGGGITDDGLVLKGSGINDYSRITILGNGNINFQTFSDTVFKVGTSSRLAISFVDPDAIIGNSTMNKDTYLRTLGTGVIKFGTYTAGAATDSIGYITIKDAAGNTRKLMVQA